MLFLCEQRGSLSHWVKVGKRAGHYTIVSCTMTILLARKTIFVKASDVVLFVLCGTYSSGYNQQVLIVYYDEWTIYS